MFFSATCSRSNELETQAALQEAMHMHDMSLNLALQHIETSNAALQMLLDPVQLGPTLQAELLVLKLALDRLHAACQSQEMMALATARFQ